MGHEFILDETISMPNCEYHSFPFHNPPTRGAYSIARTQQRRLVPVDRYDHVSWFDPSISGSID